MSNGLVGATAGRPYFLSGGRVMNLQRRGKIWMVTSGELTAEVTPSQGGKIRRLMAQPQKRNLFFTDPRRRFPISARGKYLAHDISGFDECFPTVGTSEGIFGQDHGLLWDRPWQAEQQGKELVTWITRPGKMPVQFIRRISAPRPNHLRQEYTVLNLGTNLLPFIYSAHPILALDPESKISLPGVKTLSVLGHNGVFKAQRVQPWPLARVASGHTMHMDTVFIPEKQAAGKWFAQGQGNASVSFPGISRTLHLTWDAETLPYLGIWLSLGVALDPRISSNKWICAALEPCTSPHDVLSATRKPCILSPERPFNFWIEWELRKMI